MGMFTRQQKAKCAARETAMRHHVYRAKVAAGAMSSAEAASEEAMMKEIAADYAEPAPVTAADLVEYYHMRDRLIGVSGEAIGEPLGLIDELEVAVLDIRAKRGEALK